MTNHWKGVTIQKFIYLDIYIWYVMELFTKPFIKGICALLAIPTAYVSGAFVLSKVYEKHLDDLWEFDKLKTALVIDEDRKLNDAGLLKYVDLYSFGSLLVSNDFYSKNSKECDSQLEHYSGVSVEFLYDAVKAPRDTSVTEENLIDRLVQDGFVDSGRIDIDIFASHLFSKEPSYGRLISSLNNYVMNHSTDRNVLEDVIHHAYSFAKRINPKLESKKDFAKDLVNESFDELMGSVKYTNLNDVRRENALHIAKYFGVDTSKFKTEYAKYLIELVKSEDWNSENSYSKEILSLSQKLLFGLDTKFADDLLKESIIANYNL